MMIRRESFNMTLGKLITKMCPVHQSGNHYYCASLDTTDRRTELSASATQAKFSVPASVDSTYSTVRFGQQELFLKNL